MAADDAIRAHFDEGASNYDDWWLGTGRFAERERPDWHDEVAQLVTLVRDLPPARVLDVACGTGFLTQHLRGEITGLDQSAAMLEIAAARMPRARIVQGEALPLPFADGEFDRVFTSHFFHHLPADGREAFVKEALRVARELVVVEDVRRPDAPAGQSHGHAHRHAFTAVELAAELGGGARVLHSGRWFAIVASS
jgi:ubiquinone/menaquinone biosynthesis C-methylase UbiE